jgi:hypothetical protein
MIALTREPSGRRASTSGVDSSMRRPTREMMRSMMWRRWPRPGSHEVSSSLPVALDVHLAMGVDQVSLTSSSSSSGVIGPRSKVSWSSSADQALLVAAGQPDIGLDQHAARDAARPGAALGLVEPSSSARSSLPISSRWSCFLMTW